MVLQPGGMFLPAGAGRYSVAANIAGDPSATVSGEFPQDTAGSVLTARTTTEHLNAIINMHTILAMVLLNTEAGLEDQEDEDAVVAAAYLGMELHQHILLVDQLNLPIDEEVYQQLQADLWHTLSMLQRQLEHMREIHNRGHNSNTPYLPEYFAFITAHPLPELDAVESAEKYA